ncbi:SDR family NAD(P)-dependent oxidoreductase [Phenylobacterium sp.]|jgi:NAD(P)-dependent dehydrogenase (short-subunit alcohol dehydrogenase family)|uniref:SDR family NAD(P)-dependent oxidoreductase n=1 Tax=Phenylobacterium sp. TaxID=1871053 RepID=UPI0037C4F9DA
MPHALNRRGLLGAASLAAIAAPAAAQTPAPTSLAGKTVLITGASSGFGRLSALHLADLGATVIASMRNLDGGKRPDAVSLLAEAKGKPGKVHLVEIDVTKPDQVVAGVAAAERIAGGGLDAVLSNAGIGGAGPIELQDEIALETQFQTNLLGSLRVARAALPAMRAKKAGLIMPVSSQLGRIVMPNIGAYCSSKWGLEAAFEALAYELAPFGVEVTIIQPGGYPTRIWESGGRAAEAMFARNEPARMAAYATSVAQTRAMMTGPRNTDPKDVARAVAELMAMPLGQRPLRRPVHPNTAVTVAVNKALAGIQAQVLGQGPYAPWHAAVVG